MGYPRSAFIHDAKDHELCLQTALAEVSQKYTELSFYSFADDGEYILGPYKRIFRHRKPEEDRACQDPPRPYFPKWELIDRL